MVGNREISRSKTAVPSTVLILAYFSWQEWLLGMDWKDLYLFVS